MPTLSLFRHAKSAWDNAGLRDFERPLAPRGKKAAPRMGRFIAEQGLAPDLVVCSTAVRARETLDLALPHFESAQRIDHSGRLYMASPQQMLRIVRALPAGADHVMLVGHNPGMHALAAGLAGEGKPADMTALQTKFPTAGLAVLDFACPWEDISSGSGRLRLFMTPGRLGQE